MKRLHKNTVKAIIRHDGYWIGYIVASNVNPWHITNGWCLGCKVHVNSIDELNTVMNDFAYYNCNSELGTRVVCYSL